MATSHLKRLNAPKTWQINRRGLTFITRPKPGAHKMELCLPMNIVLRDMLEHVSTTKEVRALLLRKEILLDGKVAGSKTCQVGLFDVLQIPKLDEHYRMLLTDKGVLKLNKIDKKEAGMKPCKIIDKTKLRGGKLQLNLDGGINILVQEGSYKTGDTLMLELPSKKILSHIKLEKGAYIFLNGGKHIGDHGVLSEVKGNLVSYKSSEGSEVETSKRYATAIGKDKPEISLFK